jgi:hypothetical protein
MMLIGGGVPGFPCTFMGVTVVAGLEDVEEIAAMDRYGINEAAGLAVDISTD